MKAFQIGSIAFLACGISATAQAQVLDDFATNQHFTDGDYTFMSVFSGGGNDPQVGGGELKINTSDGASTFGTSAFIWNEGESLSQVDDRVSVEVRFDGGPLTAFSTHIGLYLTESLAGGGVSREVNMGLDLGGNYTLNIANGGASTALDGIPSGNAVLRVDVIAASASSMDLEVTLSGVGFTTVSLPFSVSAPSLLFGPVAFDTDGSNGVHDNLTFNQLAPFPFVNYCTGDGGNQMGCTDCPCLNNAPVGSGGGCLHSGGTGSRLIAEGNTSVSLPSGATNDLRFSITDGAAFQLYILNSGNALASAEPANPCFGLGSGIAGSAFDGLRCAIMGTVRNGGRGADLNGQVGFSNAPWGGEANPTDGIAQFFGYTAGSTKYFQCIHRDSDGFVCGRLLNTSQAIEVTFLP